MYFERNEHIKTVDNIKAVQPVVIFRVLQFIWHLSTHT